MVRAALNLGAILALLGIAVVFAIRAEDRAMADRGRLSVSPHPDRQDTVVFAWSAPIEAPMAREFEAAFARAADGRSRILISLDSPGGSLAEGGAVVREIRRMKRTHTVDAVVGAGGACLSMCVPIFLEGDRRYASPDAVFLFHEPSLHDIMTDEAVDQPAFEARFSADRFFERHINRPPVDPSWAATLRKSWRGRDIVKSGAELLEEESGVVSDLL